MAYNIWIDKECKKFYSDSKKHGLRLFFDSGLDENVVSLIKRYTYFIRQQYFFPIRCNIFFINEMNFEKESDKRCFYGLFITDDSKKAYPKIYVPSKPFGKHYETILRNYTKLLTYYFQWYFYSDENRSKVSLEREANCYANYLVEGFLDSDRL